VTRGAVLAGLGAVPLAGCGVHRASCTDAAVPSATGVRVVRGVVPTKRVRTVVRYAIAVPDGAPVDAVAYLLPGRGGTADDAIGIGIDGYLAEHVRRGGQRFAIAAFDAGESYFHPRANGEDRLGVATVDGPAAVRAALRVPVRGEAIMGESMGGYGALLAAEGQPRRYRAVAVASPAIFPSFADEDRSVGDAFDSAADYAAHDVTAHAALLRGVPVFLAIGEQDPFLPGVRRFARAYPGGRLTVAPGCHDVGFWRVHTQAMLAFVGAHL
jgi:pimeloyl-ACP methyl ester carboxylesterase